MHKIKDNTQFFGTLQNAAGKNVMVEGDTQTLPVYMDWIDGQAAGGLAVYDSASKTNMVGLVGGITEQTILRTEDFTTGTKVDLTLASGILKLSEVV